MRGHFEDTIQRNVTIAGLKFRAASMTLAGALTLTDDYPTVLELDAGGSSRNVTFPARALANDGVTRFIVNMSGAGENLVLKDSDATTRLTLGPGQIAMCVAGNTPEDFATRSWRMYLIGGDDLAISDNLAVTGALTGSSATFSSSVTFNGNVRMGASTQILGLFGAAGMSQHSGASQAAFSTAAPVSISATQYGFGTSTQIQSILNFLVEARSVLVQTGLMKGSA